MIIFPEVSAFQSSQIIDALKDTKENISNAWEINLAAYSKKKREETETENSVMLAQIFPLKF